MSSVAYASPARIVGDAFNLLLPPVRGNPDSWACQKRWMANSGGGIVGRYNHDRTPYTVQPSECLEKLEHLTVVIVGPGQVAKTVIAENWLGKSIDTDQANFLWYMQTDDGIESYVKERINRFIDDHDCLRLKRGTRPVDDSLSFKNFRGMSAEFLAFGERTLINKSAPRIVADEIDAYQLLINPLSVLNVRRQTFGRQSMILAMSHPDRATGLDPAKDWSHGIMALYGDSDRRAWWWPCPHCGAWSSPCPTTPRFMTIEYDEKLEPEVIARETFMRCPVSGCVVEDHHREDMNLKAFNSHFGGWIGTGQEIDEDGKVSGELAQNDTAGFWFQGAMSPFIIGGIGGLAKARVLAEREAEQTGEELSYRTVMAKQWGFPPSRRKGQHGSIDAETLVERCDPYLKLKFVAEGVRFLTVSVDCQKWGFEYLVRGWGERGESWIVDHDRILAHPATSPDDWDKLLDVFERVYPLADGSPRGMKIRAAGFDSHGESGVTMQAYSAWKRWKRDRRVRMFGTMGGRDVWSIIPLRGSSTLLAPRLIVTYPDTRRASNRKASRGEVPVGAFNPNLFKDDLAGQLKVGEPLDWYVHFPAVLKSKELPHIFFEQMVAEHQLPNGRWEKLVPGAKNEVLDLMVMNHVVAHLHGLPRIDWSRPPSWAAEWDENPTLVTLEASDIAEDLAAAPADLAEAVAETNPVRPPAPVKSKKSNLVSRLA